MFNASCFALPVEEILEVMRGGRGGKATASFQGVDVDPTIREPKPAG